MSMISGITNMGRTQAEALMQSTITIRRKTSDAVDHNTGQTVPVFTVIYSGKCRLRFDFARVTEVQAAGQTISDQRPVLSLPVLTSGDVLTNDVAEITANPLDPSLVGKKFRIAGVHAQSQATARRFPVEVSS